MIKTSVNAPNKSYLTILIVRGSDFVLSCSFNAVHSFFQCNHSISLIFLMNELKIPFFFQSLLISHQILIVRSI